MLRHLLVRNLVVVEEATLDLNGGMTALTGETGAGKSILVDALALTLGTKADKGAIRTGAEEAEVNAVFDLSDQPSARAWLEEHALLADGDCFLRRVLSRKGRSRAFINGRAVPLRSLQELGERLVAIHGQHAHQGLLRPAVQRTLLDGWAGHRRLLSEVRRRYREWRDLRRRLQALESENEDREGRIDYLRFQLEELATVAEELHRLEELEREQRRLAGAEELLETIGQVRALLTEEEPSAQTLLDRALSEVEQLAAERAPELAPAAELLESARIQLQEAAILVRDFGTSIEPDPERLAQVDRTLARIHDLARKHRVEPADLPETTQRLNAELQHLENADAEMVGLKRAEEAASQAYRAACARLSENRKRAAAALASELTERMQELGMEGGRFEIEVSPLPWEEGSAAGLDRVEFLVATNPGETPAPLARVASGGELSRLSLAIQTATADLGEAATLVFDEVDVGIGGAVAETVGRLLHRLGRSRQVFCVTHLGQVAACADHHLKVMKEKKGERVRTRITPLDEEARVREIARMVGGSRVTRQTLAHAREMVAGATS